MFLRTLVILKDQPSLQLYSMGTTTLKVNADAENEKVFSMELGYGLRGEKFAANVNLYRTQWNDRTFTRNIRATEPGAEDYTANLLGVNALTPRCRV